MSLDMTGISPMLSTPSSTTATNSAASNKTDSIKNSANNLSSNSTEEELMEVLQDFESYFIEQIIKKMKDTFTEDDEENSVASQYTDTFMDYAIEDVADMLLEEVGGNLTQQLFEQMKRNYNIPTVKDESKEENVDASQETDIKDVEEV